MSEYLNNADLRAVTGYAQTGKQCEWLKTKAIPHKIDGSRIIVSHAHVRSWLEGRHTVSSTGPNWGALRAV